VKLGPRPLTGLLGSLRGPRSSSHSRQPRRPNIFAQAGLGASIPTFADDIALSDGVWTWFNDPRAIAVNGEPVVGAIGAAGDLLVYDAANSTVGIDLHGSTFEVDDHDNPAFLRRASDGKLLAFATKHSGANFYKYLSTNADDPTAWGAAVDIDASLGLAGYSYPNPYQLTDEANDPIYLFFRASDGAENQYYYSVSTDSGATWAAATQLLENNGADTDFPPYVKIVQNGNARLDFFCTDGHPSATATNSVYHFYYEGGGFKKTDGTPLVLPITPATHLSKVYDGTTNRAWLWDCAISAGNPVCVYTAHNSTSDHRYRFARWTGSAWAGGEICTAGSHLYTGEVYYSGGVTLDPASVSTVYASRQISGVHQIWRYTTSDFTTWTGEQITKGKRSFRPYIVRGQVTEPRLAFVEGNYGTFTSYTTGLRLKDSRIPAVTLATDAQRADVSFVATFDGSSGIQAATDFSNNAHAMTFRNGAFLSAARSKWGVCSLRLGGSATDAVTAVNHASFLFGAGDFSIETWATADDWTPATVNRFLVGVWRNDTSNRSWAIDVTTAGLLRFLGSDDGAATTVLLDFDASAHVAHQFYHIAVTKLSGTYKLWVNGAEVDSNTVAFTHLASNGTLTFGNAQNGAATWNTTNIWVGNMDGCRITKANRTIALPTEQFPIS
jgi:hypothetical protein